MVPCWKQLRAICTERSMPRNHGWGSDGAAGVVDARTFVTSAARFLAGAKVIGATPDFGALC